MGGDRFQIAKSGPSAKFYQAVRKESLFSAGKRFLRQAIFLEIKQGFSVYVDYSTIRSIFLCRLLFSMNRTHE